MRDAKFPGLFAHMNTEPPFGTEKSPNRALRHTAVSDYADVDRVLLLVKSDLLRIQCRLDRVIRATRGRA